MDVGRIKQELKPFKLYIDGKWTEPASPRAREPYR